MFQIAILYQRNDVMMFLGETCPSFLTNKPLKPITLKCGNNSEKADKVEDDSLRSDLLNCPLHLAFMSGSVATIKYLLGMKYYVTFDQVGYISLWDTGSGAGPPVLCRAVNKKDYKSGTPLELAIEFEQTECVVFFLRNILPSTFMYLYVGIQEPALCAYKACCFGLGPALKLLLKRLPHDVTSVRDRNGKTLLHVAVWSGDTESIKELLEKGASVNAEPMGCLHILYRSKFNPVNYVTNTHLLIQYGVDVDLKDGKGKTALHVLAEELRNQVTNLSLQVKSTSYIKKTISTQYSAQLLKKDLVTCMKLILNEGANPNITAGGQSVLGILIQECALLKTTHWEIPSITYSAMETLLANNANLNVMITDKRKPQMPIFTYFVLYVLKEIQDDDMRLKFVHLFSFYCVTAVDRAGQGFCYPLVAAIQNKMSRKILEFIVNLMETGHLKMALKDIKEGLLLQMMCSHNKDQRDYAETILELAQTWQLRSLQHCCKVKILKNLEQPLKEVENLPLPRYLKDYITSTEF